MRALGLDHAASLLDGASQKAIARAETPTALLDHLMRENLRVVLEERARAAVRNRCIERRSSAGLDSWASWRA